MQLQHSPINSHAAATVLQRYSSCTATLEAALAHFQQLLQIIAILLHCL
jgi:hypothetical protein